jgi:hypothetical protein
MMRAFHVKRIQESGFRIQKRKEIVAEKASDFKAKVWRTLKLKSFRRGDSPRMRRVAGILRRGNHILSCPRQSSFRTALHLFFTFFLKLFGSVHPVVPTI